MTAKVMKIRQDNEIVCYASDIRDDDSLIHGYINRDVGFVGGIAKAIECVCNEHDLHSDDCNFWETFCGQIGFKSLNLLATPAGFEPATFSLEGCCSIP